MQDESSEAAAVSIDPLDPDWRVVEDGGESVSIRDQVAVELTAAVFAIHDEQPVVLTKPSRTGGTGAAADLLPSARFRPAVHATLEDALRTGIEAETGLDIGFLEQLSSDCTRYPAPSVLLSTRQLSIGHLALTRAEAGDMAGLAAWTPIYTYFPWEDWRTGRPRVLAEEIVPRLTKWVGEDPQHTVPSHPLVRRERVAIAFGLDGGRWDDERVVERLDLLSESGLASHGVQRAMQRDHRRTLAAALGRLRAKIRYRPVVFELLPAEFTLFELQKSVEAILGPHLHQQNFRRLVEGTGLVEPTGEVRTHTGGRPAKLFRFRREVLLERPAPGVRIRPARAV
jgi:hypothetical protein